MTRYGLLFRLIIIFILVNFDGYICGHLKGSLAIASYLEALSHTEYWIGLVGWVVAFILVWQIYRNWK